MTTTHNNLACFLKRNNENSQHVGELPHQVVVKQATNQLIAAIDALQQHPRALTLLNAALPLVPSHGFTRACLLEAAHTTQLPITTQTLDGLFPSTPASHDGPTSALLQHWLAQQTSLTCDHMMASTDKPITLAKGLAYRLALNEPMKYRLRTVWSHRVFGLALPDLKAFTNHAARTTQAVEKAASMVT